MTPTFVVLAALAAWMPSWAPNWMPGHHKGPPSPVLWHGARAGMTPGQILKIFPAARAAVAGESQDGAVEGAAMPISVADHDAVARFFFGKKGLSAVDLSILDVEENRTSDNLAEARELSNGLTKSHGAPDYCDVTNATSPVRYRCEWIGAVHIELEYREAAPPPTLTVTYRLGAGGASSGL